jgi:hypothetical protein
MLISSLGSHHSLFRRRRPTGGTAWANPGDADAGAKKKAARRRLFNPKVVIAGATGKMVTSTNC